MSRRARPSALAYGRVVLVLALTCIACRFGVVYNGDRHLAAHNTVVVLCGLILLVRRLHWTVAPLATSAATGFWGWSPLPLLLLALFDLGVSCRAVAALGFGAAVLNLEAVFSSGTDSFTLRFALLLLIVVGLGQLEGNRRRVRVLHAEVEHLRIERELREEAARAAERSRIAAEMHDVLAHRLSLIALHAGVLTSTSGTLPQGVGERLELLRNTSTEALTDLRDILGALHGRRNAAPDETPAPVLRDVDELAEEARKAGERITMNVGGQPGRAPTVHRLAVYRLVQEALTNARKHAKGAPVTVRIEYGPPATVVEVENHPGDSADDTTPSGFGLVGLRERVTALGGGLDAGPGPAGGWRLSARIPHPAEPGADTGTPEKNGLPA